MTMPARLLRRDARVAGGTDDRAGIAVRLHSPAVSAQAAKANAPETFLNSGACHLPGQIANRVIPALRCARAPLPETAGCPRDLCGAV